MRQPREPDGRTSLDAQQLAQFTATLLQGLEEEPEEETEEVQEEETPKKKRAKKAKLPPPPTGPAGGNPPETGFQLDNVKRPDQMQRTDDVACPQCGAALELTDTHLYCRAAPCEYSALLSDLIPGLETYQRVDHDALTAKDVTVRPEGYTGDRCATCRFMAKHKDHEVGFCTEQHVALPVVRLNWCPRFETGVYADAVWEEIQKILPLNRPRPNALPYYAGTLESGIPVYIVNGQKIKKAKREAKSNRGYDEKDFMDYNIAGNTQADPDLYRLVWGSPKGKKTQDQIYVDVFQDVSEQQYGGYHEAIETPLMQAGIEYDPAHDEANRREKKVRSRGESGIIRA